MNADTDRPLTAEWSAMLAGAAPSSAWVSLHDTPLAYDPFEGGPLQGHSTRDQWAEASPPSRQWCFNPWTGAGRHQSDIIHDPQCRALAKWRWRFDAFPLRQQGAAAPSTTLDTQVGGDHYKKMGDHQPWVVLKAWLTPEEFRGYMKGTAIAYLARELDKGGMQDIAKAAHTLDALVELSGESTEKPAPRRA